MMVIDIWSDMVCPFCYIGKRRLEKALSLFDGADEVSLRFRSFQLDPGGKSYEGRDLHATLAEVRRQLGVVYPADGAR